MGSCFCFSRGFFLYVVFIGVIFASGSGTALAQASRNNQAVERRIETMNRQAKEFERDNMERDGKPVKDTATAKKNLQTRLEIEGDLMELQAAYNTIVTALQTGSELRPKFAGETAGAIRKNAIRLKSNLVLPEPENLDAKAESGALSSSERQILKKLCLAIYEFITNPMFENGAILDVKHGTKARKDLDAVIRLADNLMDASSNSSK